MTKIVGIPYPIFARLVAAFIVLGLSWSVVCAQPVNKSVPPPVPKEASEQTAPEVPEKSKVSKADNQQIEVADEYMRRDDFAKAAEFYNKLARRDENIPIIHRNYMLCLEKLGKADEQESYLKRIVRNLPKAQNYKIDLARFYASHKETEKAESIIKKLCKQIADNPNEVVNVAKYSVYVQHGEWAEQLFTTSRKALRDNLLYTFEMAEVYRMQNRLGPMLAELIALAERDANNLQQIQNTLQAAIGKPTDFDTLEKVLIKKTQENAGVQVYSELLLWLYIQQRDFNSAFIQARALDKRNHTEAQKCVELANLCIANKDYEAAINILEYVSTDFQGRPVYFQSKRLLINTREEQLRNSYPVNKADVEKLITEYRVLNTKIPNRFEALDNLRSIALLYGTYLNQVDSAIAILSEIIKYPRADRNLIDKSKVDLGDMYLLQGTFWEATLLYSQVEKSQKESPLGYESKLRNAKLSYFKGEFELAQEHLDVLKLATSREIANDAMNLALLIQDNLAFDSTGKALQAYANVELLLFQHREEAAMKALDKMDQDFPKNSLSDEVLWLRARIYKRIRQFDLALANLEKIVTLYPTDLYGDDALFMEGTIYEDEKGDKTKAMALYEQLLKSYPGSIFGAEARKRFRLLRGDKLNLPTN